MTQTASPGNFDLTGRVALVTGGNGGIGLGMALGMAHAGASIAIAARDAAKMEAAKAEIEATGAKAMTVAIDVADEANVKDAVAKVVAEMGGLHILAVNAGMNIRKPPQNLATADWLKIMDVNLNSAFYSANAAYPHMKAAGFGKVITIGSMASIFGLPFSPAYAATKGGIVQFTRVLATAWAPDNIQANAILPGWIDTALTQQARKDVDGLHQRVLDRTPAGRWGVPDDFGGIAAFLASSASDFVTGTAIPVDGGYSINGG